jgi:hypothetical protein
MAIYRNESIPAHVEAIQLGVDDFPAWVHNLTKSSYDLCMVMIPASKRQIFKLKINGDISSCCKGDYIVRDIDSDFVFLMDKNIFLNSFPENSKEEDKASEINFPVVKVSPMNGEDGFSQIVYEFGMEVAFAKSFKEFIGNREFDYVDYGRCRSIKIKMSADKDEWKEARDQDLISVGNNGDLSVTSNFLFTDGDMPINIRSI